MNGSTFLIVDDDASFVQVLARTLNRKNYQTFSASNPADCLMVCQQTPPDFVILDLNLQGESGLRLIEPILQYSPAAKILVLTGYASIATAVNAVKLGATHYLAKPASIQDILQSLIETDTHLSLEAPEDKMTVHDMEWDYIQRVLNENDGNISATAKALKMHRRTLQRKLMKKRPIILPHSSD